MCIFTGKITQVASTRIFTRLDMGRQVIVYDMHLDSDIETAMVLPIPVSLNEPVTVDFIDLSNTPHFFNSIDSLFPQIHALEPLAAGVSRSFLKVKEVGMYEASFVPSRSEFVRLDPRFQVSDTLFESVTEYNDYGFVVFKLKPGNSRVHPMAFWFSSRFSDKLFFPTVHMHHDGVNNYDFYDHVLYAQGEVQYHPGLISTDEASGTHSLSRLSDESKGVVSPFGEIVKQHFRDYMKNCDIYFPLETLKNGVEI